MSSSPTPLAGSQAEDPDAASASTTTPAATKSLGISAAPALLVAATTLAVAIGAAFYTGATAPQELSDPGPLVRWGVLVLRALADLGATLAVGTSVVAAVALPTTPGPRGHIPRAWGPAMILISAASALWAAATAFLAALRYADLMSISLGNDGFATELWSFLTSFSLGQGLAFTVTVAALMSLIAAGSSSIGGAGALSLLGVLGMIPAALAGHSAGNTNHETAVTALGVHLIAVVIWVGGLVALMILWPGLHRDGHEAVVVRRYSPVALVGAAGVGLGGVLIAWARLSSFSDLFTSAYGQLISAKTLAFAGLIGFGWWHRRHGLAQVDAGTPGAFRRLALVEIAVMATAIGLAVTLANSAPPVPDRAATEITMVESLTGYPLPPPPTLSRWLFSWQPDLFWLLIVGLGAGLYLTAVVRLRRRGDSWPLGRTIPWLAGLLVLTWVTCGGPMVYGRVQFSAHMAGHMVIGMAVPLLLVMGAPITLAMRALTPRGDGTFGPREWIVSVVESRYSRVITQPVVAGFFFAGTLFLFYFSPLLTLALRTHVGHEVMHLHFLAAGFLFMWVLIGVDPGPHRPSPALRLMFMFGVIGFHAFFGVALMMSKNVLAQGYFEAVGRNWGASLLDDQRSGGGFAWGFGEVPMLIVAMILAWQWSRSDERDARRLDRAADRDGDAELNAYNAMLAAAADNDAKRDRLDGR